MVPQLSRVFLIRGPIYFSKILFVPETGSRIPVGREAHSASQYDELTTPYRDRNWPNGLLRFTAIDEPQQVSPRPNPENQSQNNQVSSRSSPTFNDISGTTTTQNLFIDPVEYARANEGSSQTPNNSRFSAMSHYISCYTFFREESRNERTFK